MLADKLLWIFVPLLPLCWVSPGLPRNGQLVAMTVMATMMLAALIPNIWIRAFGFYVAAWHLFVQVLYFIEPSAELNVAKQLLVQSTMFCFYGIAIMVVVYKSTAPIEWFYNAICVSAIVQMLAAIPNFWDANAMQIIMNWIFGESRVLNPFVAVTGTLENPNFFSAYLAISLPFFFRPMWRTAIPAIAFFILKAHTSAAIITAGAAVVVYFQSWKLAVVGMIISAGHLWRDGHFGTWSEGDRMVMWLKCLGNIKLNWFNLSFGHGLGQHWGEESNLHNDWLQMLYELGIVGTSIFAGYIITIWRHNRILFAAFVAAAVNMAGSYPTRLAPSMFLIIVILGLIERSRKDYKEQNYHHAVAD